MLWPGKTEAQKRDLTDAIVRDVTSILHHGDESVSVGFEEVAPNDWSARVYEPDIQLKWGRSRKSPDTARVRNPQIERLAA